MPGASGMVGEVTSVADQVPLTVEAQSRLLQIVCSTLGSNGQWTPALVRQLSGLARGFELLAAVQPLAEPWRDGLRLLLRTQPQIERVDRQVHKLATLIEQQPGHMPPSQSNACHVLATLAFASLRQGMPVTGQVLDGLKQLFRSTTREWESFRESIALPALFAERTEGTDGPELLKKFARTLPHLLELRLTFPVLEEQKPQQEDELPEVDETAAAEPTQKARKPSKFDSTPNFALFEFQIVQQEHEPALNSYRLQNDWNSLTESELAECCSILVRQLRAEPALADFRARRLHAACRFVSMFAQLSLEVAASIPIRGEGSLHLNLQHGMLKRDLQVVAPRTDRPNGVRWRTRWKETPLPPEIHAALVSAARDHPDAITLGDLLIGERLTPEICYDLLNAGRRKGRPFESLRVGRAVRTFYLRQQLHPTEISRILGDITVVPRAQQYYVLLDQQRVYAGVNSFCHMAGLAPVSAPEEQQLIGSPKFVDADTMKTAYARLHQENHKAWMSVTRKAGLEEIIRFHHGYVCRFALQLLWSVGGRCQNLSSITAQDLFSDSELIILGDRASDRYSQRRVCVLTEPIAQSRLMYAEHLFAMTARLEKLGESEAAKWLDLIRIGADPHACALQVFYVHKEHGLSLRPITRADLKKVARRTGLMELNVPRHFLITTLVEQNVAAAAIDALVGHHQAGAPPFGFGSGMSILEFCAYIKPVLSRLHSTLGIEPLQGLGRADPSRWELPLIATPVEMPLPESEFLRQRLEVDDFNPPEIFLAEEDCPISPETLAARSELQRLRSVYKRSDAVGRHAWGAVAFCLIAFNSIVTAPDLRAFAERLLAGEDAAAGVLRAVEVFEDGDLPVAQLLLAPSVVDALQVARRCEVTAGFDKVLYDFDILLRSLDPHWPADSPSASLARLLSLTAHAVMLEQSSVARFGLLHKSPFIAASDLRRLQSEEPTRVKRPLRAAPQKAGRNGFERVVRILRHHANRDDGMGEAEKRRHTALAHLARWEDKNGGDEADVLLLEFVRAELRDAAPPFNRLGLPTLCAYLPLQIPFFEQVRMLGRLPRTADEWTPIERIFQDDVKSEGKRRWAGLHVAAWLQEKGLPVPPALRKPGSSTDKVFRPHLSAYVLPSELDHALDICHADEALVTRPGWDRLRFRVARTLAARPAELRYLKARHVSADGACIQITTSGHDHLKTEWSRGLLSVPDDLRLEVREHSNARKASPARRAAAMFVPSTPDGYALYDNANTRVQDAIRAVTGREDFRLYDLRANALTDMVFDLRRALEALKRNEIPAVPISTAADLNKRFARAAAAAREARQASIHTLLRYYHLGGSVERYCAAVALDQAHPAGASYTAALQGKSVDAIYARRSRDRRGAGERTPRVERAPIRAGEGECGLNQQRSTIPRIDRLLSAATVKGVVLHLAGCSMRVASDHVGVPLGVVKLLYLTARSDLERADVAVIDPLFACANTTWGKALEPACEWAYHHRRQIANALGAGGGFRPRGAEIRISGSPAFDGSGGAWKDLVGKGIQPLVYLSAKQPLEDKSALRGRFANSMVVQPDELKRGRVAVMKFCTHSERRSKDGARPSAHVMGKVGRLVVASMIVAASAAVTEEA